MFSAIKVFFAGLFISFLGSLPLGALNITAMQISIQENSRRALFYALGVAIIELIYVRLSLNGIAWILSNQKIFYILEWASVFIFLLLAIASFIALRKPEGQQKNILLNTRMNRFILGMTMSAINPVQIPFWFLWSSYLISIGILNNSLLSFNLYTIGIGTGTVTGFLFFIFGGRWLANRLNARQRSIHIIVGIVFLISAIIQWNRLTTKKMEDRLKNNTRLRTGVVLVKILH